MRKGLTIGAFATLSHGRLDGGADQYTDTTEFAGATRIGAARSGGSADLHYRFTLDGASITRLVIEP